MPTTHHRHAIVALDANVASTHLEIRRLGHALTPAGRAYARGILRPVHEAEEAAMRRTLEEYSPDFLLAVEALTGHLCRTFRDHILKEKER